MNISRTETKTGMIYLEASRNGLHYLAKRMHTKAPAFAITVRHGDERGPLAAPVQFVADEAEARAILCKA